MIINHISVSRLGTFEECPLKYRYKYHDKLTPTVPQQDYFTLGKYFHKVIELATPGDRDIKDIALEVLAESKDGTRTYPVKQEDVPRIPKFIQAFLELQGSLDAWIPRDRRTEVLEHEFSIPTEAVSEDGTNIPAYGFIDRIIRYEDNGQEKALIIDYKTTKAKNQKSIAEAAKDRQLMTYTLAVSRTFGIAVPNISTMLYYLEGKRRVPAKFTEEDVQENFRHLSDTSMRIVTMPPESAVARVSSACRFCEYRNICPAIGSR